MSLKKCISQKELEVVRKRLDALEKLVLKQHNIIGILINAGKRMEKEMKENEEED